MCLRIMSTTSNEGSRRVRRRKRRGSAEANTKRASAPQSKASGAKAQPSKPQQPQAREPDRKRQGSQPGRKQASPRTPDVELPTATLSAPLPPLIVKPQDLEAAANALASSPEPLALDTERSGGYTYANETCLLQLRKEGVGTFLVDTLAIPNLTGLSAGLGGTWILHAADQDLLGMQELGVEPTSVFDTEIAARLTGHERFSLGALSEDVLGLHLKKSHQNENWSTRPLPDEWLQYAALDVELLPGLHEHLAAKLDDLGRTDYANQEFEYLVTDPLEPRLPTWRDTKGLGKVRSRRGLAVARELWEERERIGEIENVAAGRILPNAAVVAAALRPPKNKHQLRQIQGFLKPSARKYLHKWQRAVDRAMKLPDADLPALRTKPDPDAVPPARTWKRSDPEAWKRLQLMRDLTAKAAEDLEIHPDVTLEPRVQREVAWQPMTDAKLEVTQRMEQAGARPWQRDLIDHQINKLDETALRTFKG